MASNRAQQLHYHCPHPSALLQPATLYTTALAQQFPCLPQHAATQAEKSPSLNFLRERDKRPLRSVCFTVPLCITMCVIFCLECTVIQL